MSKRLLGVALALLFLIVAVACEGTIETTVTPAGAYTPAFEEAECAFPVPEGFKPRCGYLVVPEDRSLPESRTIRLGVAIFKSTAADPAPDPVIHLIGGPGSSALNNALPILMKGKDILQHRDYILFDQRGTQYSDPWLYCLPYDEYLWDAREQDLSLEEYNNGALPFLADCLADWRQQGIDLAAYTSVESAADVNDLRLALGYDQVDLYGTSYGSRLALTVMRDFPAGIRSVILDSVEPLQAELGFAGLASNYWRSLQLVFRACAADVSCSAYGDLEAKYFAVIERLEETPVTVDTYGPYRAEPYAVVLDGDLFIDAIFGTLYSMSSIPDIPYFINAAYRGAFAELSAPVGGSIGMPVSTGLYWTTECREEAPFASKLEEFIRSLGVPDVLDEHFDPGYILDTCVLWTVLPADSKENRGAVSDIPTLIFAGAFDPITPPAEAKLVARALNHHFYYEFPGMSHGVMRSDPCALQMGLAFLDDPTRAPDLPCLTGEVNLEFR
jgi:pimeloyl-ACP methyl ester carboxylesterase